MKFNNSVYLLHRVKYINYKKLGTSKLIYTVYDSIIKYVFKLLIVNTQFYRQI